MKHISKMMAFAAFAALISSCSSEAPVQPGAADDGMAHFSVALPSGINTRDFADGASANTLYYQVFAKGTNSPLGGVRTAAFSGLKAEASFPMVKGQEYDVTFFAANSSAYGAAYTLNGKQLDIDYSQIASNDEKYDAFFGQAQISAAESATGFNKDVMLFRPFAQLNLGSSDQMTDAIITAVYGSPADFETSVTVTGTYFTQLDLMTGVAANPQTSALTFKAVAPADAATDGPFPANTATETYEWLTMNYLLVGNADITGVTAPGAAGQKGDFDCAFAYYKPQATTPVFTLNVDAVPMQSNYQTNIYGAVLTSNGKYNVTINPNFAGTADDMNVTSIPPSTALIQKADGSTVSIHLDGDVPTSLGDALKNAGDDPIINIGEMPQGQSLYFPHDLSNEGEVVFRGDPTAKNKPVINTEKFMGPNGNAGQSCNVSDQANLVFENVVVEFPMGTNLYGGFMFGSGKVNNSITYRNCIVKGAQFGVTDGQKFIFENCVLENTSYCFQSWGCGDAQFIGCTFNINNWDKAALNFYGSASGPRNFIIKDCTFNQVDNSQAPAKAAIQINSNEYGPVETNVIISGSTNHGFLATSDPAGYHVYGGGLAGVRYVASQGLWHYGKALTITVNGVDVFKMAADASDPSINNFSN